MGLISTPFTHSTLLRSLNKFGRSCHFQNYGLSFHFTAKGLSQIRRTCSQMARGNRVLNVAEKNDAAKSLSDLMSNGRFRRVCKICCKTFETYS